MKQLLLSACILISPVFAMSKPQEKASPVCIEDDANEPDLFRRNEQVYTSSVNFLYWTVAEGGLDFALKMNNWAWSPTTPSYAQGNFESATYGMDPGFRLNLVYFRAPHYWEVKWEYTHLSCNGSNTASKPKESEKYLTGTWPQILPGALSQATSYIHLNYNTFDWVIDRVFFPNPHLRLRVVAGWTAAWMDQFWNFKYSDSNSNQTSITNRWHYVGAGLKTGSVFDWFWTGELYVTGLWSTSLLIGDYSNHAKQTTTYQPDGSANPAIPVRDTNYGDVRPSFNAQMAFGPSWQRNFTKSRVEVFAGFEMNLWWNLQEIYRSTSGIATAAKETWVNSSMMALYGLTTRVTVDF